MLVNDHVCMQERYIKAVGVGILKVMAKMGISTLQSYKGAQIFEALGLADDVIDLCFPGTASRISGLTLSGLSREAVLAHEAAFGTGVRRRLLRFPEFSGVFGSSTDPSCCFSEFSVIACAYDDGVVHFLKSAILRES